MDAGEPQDREEEPLGPHLEAEEPVRQPASSPPPRDDSTPDEGTTMHGTPVAERLGLKKFGRGYIWTRQGMLEAVRVYATEHGEPPNREDAKRAPLGMLPSTKSIGAEFSDWDSLIVAAGYTPRAKGSGLGPSGEESGRPTPTTGAAPAQAEEPAPSPEHSLVVVAELRDPIRTADIPYDAEILEDEADFLRERAEALDQIAAGVRALAAASRRDVDGFEEDVAA